MRVSISETLRRSKAGSKPKSVVFTKEQKLELAKVIWVALYPASVKDQVFEITEAILKAVNDGYQIRIKTLKGESTKAPYTGKPRGRRPRI